MDGRNAAGMSRRPSLKHVERFRPAHFTNDDAIRAKAQGRAHQVCERDIQAVCAKRYRVLSLTLKLARIFEDENAVTCVRYFQEQCIGERGFTA